jgi:hypothetical protein
LPAILAGPLAAIAIAAPTWGAAAGAAPLELRREHGLGVGRHGVLCAGGRPWTRYDRADGTRTEVKDGDDVRRGTQDTVTLFRPVGQAELDLIRAAEFRAFPARLAHQPIFYPVLDEAYAVDIARDWNANDAASRYVGYVTRFTVRAAFLSGYEVKTVGSSAHREYWIPAEDLEALNRNVVGRIAVVGEYRGGR